MSKRVLISFLGTGPLESKETRTYRTANYHLGEADLGNYPFVSAALSKHYAIDKVLLVGTVHSMWEEVYRWFCEQSGKTFDENIYFEIADACEKASHNTPLAIPHQESIEQVLGSGSKVILIKYGIIEQDITENIKIILGLQQYLDNGDELIVDITHSFRSLPIFMMNLLIYLQNVSPKNITISHIHYGMLEVTRELGYTPIVDLKAMMDVQEWITGAYAFSMFGNTYKISKLLETENKSVAPILRGFSDTMNLNYLYPMQSETQKLSGIKTREYKTDLPKLIISPIVNQFVETFKVKSEHHRQSHFQLKLSEWQYRHKKYGQAYLTSNDALISYVCEINDMPWDDFDCREAAKAALKGKPEGFGISTTQEMRQWFKSHNNRRNGIAHTTKLTKVHFEKGQRVEKEMTTSDIIKTLEADLSDLKAIIHLT
ncbi:MAG: TIGR02221 family CRISPR-associated protein [Prevotella sp.]|nr:TIGR02221 family CRISPR-associated protein [Prevotella sp.]